MFLISTRYPFRSLPAKDTIEKAVAAVGNALRGAGAGLDELGKMVMGPTAIKDDLQPSMAFAPMKYNPKYPPTMGTLTGIPEMIKRPMAFSQIVMPVKGADVFIAPSANVMGDVKIGSKCSIWYGAVLRGDVNGIQIGDKTNIQDNVTIHVARNSISGAVKPTIVGNNCTVGHGATLHACTIGDNVLVGMGAIVLDDAVVESGSIVAAGAVVPPRKVIPTGQVWGGNPAAFIRNVEEEEVMAISDSADSYYELSLNHKFENSKSFEEVIVEELIETDRDALYPYNSAHNVYEFDYQTCMGVRRKHR